MRVWSFVNQKGGSGKSTLLIHVATSALASGLSVVVIDTDPQRSTDKWAHLRAGKTGEQTPVVVPGLPAALKSMIAAAEENGADLVLIDTPAVIDKTLGYVAAGSHMIIVPTRSSYVDRESLAETLDYLDCIQALPKSVIVFNAFTSDKKDRAATQEVAGRFGVGVLPTEVEANVAMSTALGRGSSATEAKAKSKITETIGNLYRDLTVLDRKLARSITKVKA